MNFYSLGKAIYLAAKWNLRDRQNHKKVNFAEYHGKDFARTIVSIWNNPKFAAVVS